MIGGQPESQIAGKEANLHYMLPLQGSFSTVIIVSTGKIHDVNSSTHGSGNCTGIP